MSFAPSPLPTRACLPAMCADVEMVDRTGGGQLLTGAVLTLFGAILIRIAILNVNDMVFLSALRKMEESAGLLGSTHTHTHLSRVVTVELAEAHASVLSVSENKDVRV